MSKYPSDHNISVVIKNKDMSNETKTSIWWTGTSWVDANGTEV